MSAANRQPRRRTDAVSGRVGRLPHRIRHASYQRQGDAQVFKRYSQATLNMKREALTRLDRTANEHSVEYLQRQSPIEGVL